MSCNSAALKTGTALRAQAAQQALAVSAARYSEHLSRQKFATSAVGSRGGGERELERGLIRLRQIELEHARALFRGEAGPSLTLSHPGRPELTWCVCVWMCHARQRCVSRQTSESGKVSDKCSVRRHALAS